MVLVPNLGAPFEDRVMEDLRPLLQLLKGNPLVHGMGLFNTAWADDDSSRELLQDASIGGITGRLQLCPRK